MIDTPSPHHVCRAFFNHSVPVPVTPPADILCFGPPESREAVLRRLRAGGILPDADGAGAGGAEVSGRVKGKGRAAVESRLSQLELDTSLERMFDGEAGGVGERRETWVCGRET